MSFSMLELLIVLRQQRNKGFNSSDIMRDWCATVSFIVYSVFLLVWVGDKQISLLASELLKFNVNGASTWKLGPVDMRDILRNENLNVLCSFCALFGIK